MHYIIIVLLLTGKGHCSHLGARRRDLPLQAGQCAHYCRYYRVRGSSAIMNVTTFTLYCCSSNLSVVVVLDLSKPEELWTTLEVFIKQVGTQLFCVSCTQLQLGMHGCVIV